MIERRQPGARHGSRLVVSKMAGANAGKYKSGYKLHYHNVILITTSNGIIMTLKPGLIHLNALDGLLEGSRTLLSPNKFRWPSCGVSGLFVGTSFKLDLTSSSLASLTILALVGSFLELS